MYLLIAIRLKITEQLLSNLVLIREQSDEDICIDLLGTNHCPLGGQDGFIGHQ